MKLVLTAMEARAIGCLIEKQITTPDQYPLSLNALTNACNQKSNRDPMMDVDEATVQRTLDDLGKKHLILERSGFGSRVPKYQHRFCNTEFGTLKLSPQELAIVCELLVRGPQTPGELRTRASRMAPIADGGEAERILEGLRTREDGPFVARLPREPGRRDSRYAHLFSGPIEDVPYTAAAANPSGLTTTAHGAAAQATTGYGPASAGAAPVIPVGASNTSTHSRLERLEDEVRQLREEIAELKQRLPP